MAIPGIGSYCTSMSVYALWPEVLLPLPPLGPDGGSGTDGFHNFASTTMPVPVFGFPYDRSPQIAAITAIFVL